MENIEGSSDLWQYQGVLYRFSLSRTVVFHFAFDPMKPCGEKKS